MATSEHADKVLIIGAGLAGLVLAHILHENNIPYEIFERDNGPHGRKQGWAVALVECLPALRELLPQRLVNDLQSNSVNANTGEPDEIGFIDSRTGEHLATVGGKPYGQQGSVLRVSREHFRDFLWDTTSGLKIQTNKRFLRYEEDSQGVTAHFDDGSMARGALLIGADGAHSHTLDQLVGKDHHRLELSKLVPIFCEADIPPMIFEPFRRMANAVILGMSPGIHLQIGMMWMDKDNSSAHYFWNFIFHRDDPAELSDWVQHAGKQELYDFIEAETRDLHPSITALVHHAGPGVIALQPRFLEYVTPEAMPTGRVSAIGDAVHSMVPLRGAGANTAILDACDLGRMLVNASKEGKDLSSVLPAYHEVMIPRGRENVLSSRNAGEMEVEEWASVFRRPES